jgi:hypothetical protein
VGILALDMVIMARVMAGVVQVSVGDGEEQESDGGGGEHDGNERRGDAGCPSCACSFIQKRALDLAEL